MNDTKRCDVCGETISQEERDARAAIALAEAAPDLLYALDALRRVAYDVENYVLITTPQLRSDLRDALRAADAACRAVTGETGARARGGKP